MNETKEVNEIHTLFQNTLSVPERDAEAVACGRSVFLEQALAMKPPVSMPPKRRHNEWLNNIFHKERVTMFATILVVISLLLGGSGAAVHAAQTSMPDQPLYAVKMWTEQVRSDFSVDPDVRYQLMLRFADQRVNELEYLTRAGKTPPEGILERLRLHLDECLQLTIQKDDPKMLQMLEQLRTRLQLQDNRLSRLEEPAGPPDSAILTRARTMLLIRLQLIETAKEDPQQFREQVRAGIPDKLGEQQQKQETTQENFQQQERLIGDDPQSSAGEYGPGPESGGYQWGQEEPESGSGYGPGPEYGGTGGNEEPPQQGNEYGPGPENGEKSGQETTEPYGSSYGPGPGDGGSGSGGSDSGGNESGGSESGCGSSDGCQKSGGGDSGGTGNKK
jgi:uncharacterized membrane protein YgcG